MRWRVLTDATERNDGETLSEHACALGNSKPESFVSGGVRSVGENARYERSSPGERMGDERSAGERTAGSECVARWQAGADAHAAASGKHAENVNVRFEGRRRCRAMGTSGRVVDGAGLGDGRPSVSREPRRRIGEARRLESKMRYMHSR